MIKKGDLEFGDIVWTEFDPSVGHEYQNKRPAIVIQSNEQLNKSNLVTVMPLTTQAGNVTGDDIIIPTDQDNRLRADSVAKVYCITSFDYSRFSKKIGKVNAKLIIALKEYLKKHFDL
ncbi:MAG: type II toxin-antitoxin system PemK/MazF family toxin [Patescibacteria group bacterium]|jgi:mRNA interferase MazF